MDCILKTYYILENLMYGMHLANSRKKKVITEFK
jgi:hypothetical protein